MCKCLPLRRAMRRSSSEIVRELVVASLEGNVDTFSPVCDLEIGPVKDVALASHMA